MKVTTKRQCDGKVKVEIWFTEKERNKVDLENLYKLEAELCADEDDFYDDAFFEDSTMEEVGGYLEKLAALVKEPKK